MRGGDTTGLRAYNERLIVDAIRRSGPLSKAELARATGLSGQAASVIVNALTADGALIKLAKVRGKVGQPHTPIALNPDGAFSVGVKVGRRSVEAILVDFLGAVRERRVTAHQAPLPRQTMDATARFTRELLDSLSRRDRRRVVGLGVAMPGELHEWADEIGADPRALAGWRDLDVAVELAERTGLPVELYNDATAACAAEMLAGEAISRRSALYIYLGAFIGGGVVLDGKLYRGEQLNAGAIGSMPASGRAEDGRPAQLIHCASVIQLERALEAAGLDVSRAISEGGVAAAEPVFDRWCARAVAEVSRAAVAAMAVIDFQAIVVDGILNPRWRRRFVSLLGDAIGGFDRAGLSPADVVSGSIGAPARVLGAALLPLRARFSPDPDLLVASAPSPRAESHGAAADL